MNKKYWQSIEETKEGYKPSEEEKESSMMEILANESNETSSSRRDFLKWCGISFFSATVISACENPVKKAIPYLHQPETLTPGKANWYASTFSDGNQYSSILVKCRDGRPIKIEGNAMSTFTPAGTSALAQASVLGLYDDGARYKQPLHKGEKSSWDEADRHIIKKLEEINKKGGKAVLLTPTLLSPATEQLITEFTRKHPSVEHRIWDAVGYEAIREAHRLSFGKNIIPDYLFQEADLIVSFSADFLGSWLAPETFAHRYAQTRRVSEDKNRMSQHIQFEAGMSITGANADKRIPVSPEQEKIILMQLYNEVASRSGNRVISTPSSDYDTAALAEKILSHKGKALVVCGHNDLECQVLVNAINFMAQSYNNTLDATKTLRMGMGRRENIDTLTREMEKGEVQAVFFYKINPLYHYDKPDAFSKAMESLQLSVSFATAKDETAKECQWILPDNHYLEAWNDASPQSGTFSLAQPAIQPIFNTRQFQSTLLAWQNADTDFHKYLQNYWERNLLSLQNEYADFPTFWVNTLQKGVFSTEPENQVSISLQPETVVAAINNLKAQTHQELQFVLYQSNTLRDGFMANNPWLQELPDSITKISWDNYAAVSPAFAEEHALSDGDILKIHDIEIPMIIQPGQAKNTISMALGYGRSHGGKVCKDVGTNVSPLAQNGKMTGSIDSWSKQAGGYAFARSQTHHSMQGRDIVRESTLDKYKENPKAGNEIRDYHLKHMTSLYPGHVYDGHHWVMMIDLNACTGCSTCAISCQAENNVPVVGKDEVRRRRIMHWMRIDRYYTGDKENPGVVFQPLMCQHCDNAPCENVCPVSATNHSHEGINQMAYNRCVGTKYCMNNCPYKVRRFNWFRYAMNERFDYNMNSELGRMVLNPDVTVRERGVVEKCSFCIQRIQESKLTAKNQRRKLKDGEVVPACQAACPSNAIVFGDVNDPSSRVAKLIKDPRNYHLLEELHTLPTVGYLTKIRNH